MIENQLSLPERALLVGVCVYGEEENNAQETLQELELLTKSADAEIVNKVLIKQSKLKAGHYIGTGKAKELADFIKENRVTMVVFDNDLSPVQGRNLEVVMKVRILDRTQLILDIFALRAQTREGSLQVQLAQHQYLLPRLRRMWTHLERQKGGIGLRGPGETQLEMDRRRIQLLIRTLKRDLELVRTRRAEQRRSRKRHGWYLMSLVGYTNAGKSTLLNQLSDASIFTQDQLFATLDPTTRQVQLPNHESILMTDTVGFIQKLPTHLVEAFKATLEEVVQADLLLHIIDASSPQIDTQIQAVHQVLEELGVIDKPMVYIFNKIDTEIGMRNAKHLMREYKYAVGISALTGEGIDDLYVIFDEILKSNKQELKLSIPLSEGKLLGLLKEHAVILKERYEDVNAELIVRVSPKMASQCLPFKVK